MEGGHPAPPAFSALHLPHHAAPFLSLEFPEDVSLPEGTAARCFHSPGQSTYTLSHTDTSFSMVLMHSQVFSPCVTL